MLRECFAKREDLKKSHVIWGVENELWDEAWNQDSFGKDWICW